jgi:hypothetical protein
VPEEYFFVSDLHIGGDEQLKITLIPGNHDYERIRKAAPHELSLLQRLVFRKPRRDPLEDIPKRTVIG